MKFLSWMQNKFGGKKDNVTANTRATTYHAKQEPREEFGDWPHGLLAIGTFGNNNEIKENSEKHNRNREDLSPSEEVADFTAEEIGKLQKELTKLLKRKPNVEKEIAELPLDRFLNCPSSLEVDRRAGTSLCSDNKEEDVIVEKTLGVILGKCKEICADSSKKAIGKKSISFLLKKMFVCASGFAPPAPSPSLSLRDTLQDQSRMDKLLRTILRKKIYSQNSSRASPMKKCLEDRKMTKNEDEAKEMADDGCKWVKTDSEYIVLEI